MCKLFQIVLILGLIIQVFSTQSSVCSSQYWDNGLGSVCDVFEGLSGEFKYILHEGQKLFHDYMNIDSLTSELQKYGIVASPDIVQDDWVCQKCMDFFSFVNEKAQEEELLKNVFQGLLGKVCGHFLNQTECDGALERYLPVFIYNFINKETDGKFHCNRLFLCNDGLQFLEFEDFQNQVLQNKPPTQQVAPTRKSGNYTIVHLSDIHIDLEYEQGTVVDCNEAQCCDGVNGYTTNNPAQLWGQMSKCDVPQQLVQNIVDYVANVVKPDILLWTGDSCAHDVWRQEQATQTEQMKIVTDYLKQAFNGSNTTIFPMFGNHEAFPVDEYDLYGNRSDYILINGSEWWVDWLGPEATQSFRENSYYSIYKPELNLRVIAINTQVADPVNFYLYPNPTDPLNQLQWLIQQLQDCEDNNQDALIMGHIPMISAQPSEWSKRFVTIIDRYTNIIKGTYYGHTHNDQMAVMRSLKTNEPVGAQFILPSLTTMTDRYPALRIYDVDRDTNTVINYRQYYLDMPQQNTQTSFNNAQMFFEFEYDFCSEYNISDYMSWNNINNWISSFETNPEVLQKYIQHFRTGSTPLPLSQVESDQNLRAGYICHAKYVVFDDIFDCFGELNLKNPVNDLYKIAQDYGGRWYNYTNA